MSFFKSIPFLAILLMNINNLIGEDSLTAGGKQPVMLENIVMYLDIPYDSKDGVEQKYLSLDVYHNITYKDTLPVIIYFHGGGWNQGDKSLPFHLIKYFTDSGYVFISANYRLSPDPYNIQDSSRIKFPIFTQDAAMAVKWVVDNISKYSGDPSQIILMGFSAGGNIASTLALVPDFLEKHNISTRIIKAVVNLDGAALNIGRIINESSGNYRLMLQNAFGNTLEEWQSASPLLNVPNSIYLPYFFLATQANVIRKSQFQELSDTLIARGITPSLYVNKYFFHNDFQQRIGDLNDPEAKEYSDIIIKFVNNVLQYHQISKQ
jgi:pimeloyl-ACP methyl ester carboxylesterase